MSGLSTLAFLPVRQGSKSIPLKNFKLLAGKPMFLWTAEAALQCKEIGKLVISTDYLEIEKLIPPTVDRTKIEIYFRNPESATDQASTESAIFDYVDQSKVDFENFLLIQATSPLLKSNHLVAAIKKFKETHADSLLSVVPGQRFIWEEIKNTSYVKPINYDPLKRPRRQDSTKKWIENGAFYITKKEALLKSRCRISGNTTHFEMPQEAYFEIDEPDDWHLLEYLLKNLSNEQK